MRWNLEKIMLYSIGGNSGDVRLRKFGQLLDNIDSVKPVLCR